MVRFTGSILVADAPANIEAIPAPFIAIPEKERHITLLSSELSPAVRKELKASWGSNTLPPFPEVTYGYGPYIADNGNKCSIACDVMEQDAIRAWVIEVVKILGLDITIDPSRVYHVSVANLTGSPFASVPDPWNHRVC